MKLLIIGNAGCGTTYLAKKISKSKKIPLFHIDDIWFKPGGYGKEFERTTQERSKIIKSIMSRSRYIIEGASGITAKQFAPKATHLIWILYPKKVCVESIKTRKLPPGQKCTNEQTQFLVKMSQHYYNKTNNSSISINTHKKIFDNFRGSRYCLTCRYDANNLKI